jgi:cobalt-precorrin-7 (C5)-methyltransferase
MKKVRVVGLGPGNLDYLLPIAKRVIEESEILIGGSRHLEALSINNKEKILLDGNYKKVMEFLEYNYSKYDIAVVVSGDTGFYSLSSMVKKYVPIDNLEFIPGISSLQYMFSKLCLTWDKALMKSVHGRKFDYIDCIDKYSYIGLLTDNVSTPVSIAEELIKYGYSDDIIFHVGERLSYEDELITSCSPLQASKGDFDPLSVVIIENKGYKGE